jgi:hypothetical protein
MKNKQPTIETGAIQHPNVQAIRNYQAAMAQGQYEKGAMVFDPAVTYTCRVTMYCRAFTKGRSR